MKIKKEVDCMTLGEISMYLYLCENSFSFSSIKDLEGSLLSILHDIGFSIDTNRLTFGKTLLFTQEINNDLLSKEFEVAPYLLFSLEKQGWVGEEFKNQGQFLKAFDFKDYLTRFALVSVENDIVRKYLVERGELLCL